MLKSKESRDTLLLIIMAIVIIVFFLYIFLPQKTSNNKESDINKIKTNKTEKITKTKPNDLKINESPVTPETQFLENLNLRIENELNLISKEILTPELTFSTYNINNLKSILLNANTDIMSHLYQFSFFDLNDMLQFKFPDFYSSTTRFNLFVSLFLIKTREELIEEAFDTLQKLELAKITDFRIYHLIENNIKKEYQLIPILFYFKHLIHQLDIFPIKDCTQFFKKKIQSIKDLTENQYLNKMRDLLYFAEKKEKFKIEWIEEDGIFSDDKMLLRNIELKVFKFLGNQYLIFRNIEDIPSNQWIHELCRADSGNIELKHLNIQSENLSNPLELQQIIYPTTKSQFTILLKKYNQFSTQNFISHIINKRIKTFYKKHTIIDIAIKKSTPKQWELELKKFGHYLKKHFY